MIYKHTPITLEMCFRANPPICDEGLKHFSMLDIEGKLPEEALRLIEDNISDNEIVEWWRSFLSSKIFINFYNPVLLDEYSVVLYGNRVEEFSGSNNMEQIVSKYNEILKPQIAIPLYIKINAELDKLPINPFNTDFIPSDLGYFLYNEITTHHEYYETFDSLLSRKEQLIQSIISNRLVVEQKLSNDFGDFIWQ